jgi:hypothetical protein
MQKALRLALPSGFLQTLPFHVRSTAMQLNRFVSNLESAALQVDFVD